MSDQTGLYQDGNSVFENVFIQGTLNVATANEKLVVHSDGISIDNITTNSDGKTTRIDGHVGINSSSPSATLDIHDMGSTGPCVLIRGATSTEGDVTVPDGENFNFGHWNYSSSTFTERIRITSNGSVVVGGDTPATVGQTQLTLRSNSQVGLSLLCGAVQNATITFGGLADGYSSGDSGYADGKIMYDNSNNHMQFDTAGDERLRINSGGQVNIGGDYSQTTHTLKVTGSIKKTVYEPGEIIETLVGVCDGNDVTVQSGTYTLANVNVEQALTNTHATISGSSIDYAPPAGTTRVCYEFWVYLKDAGSNSDSRPLVHFRSQLRNASDSMTTIDNSRHTWRFASSQNVQDVQTWVYNKVIVSIGQVSTESVANGRLVNWDSARTFRWQARRYSASYAGILHETNNWDGSGTDIRVRPHVKITAIA